MSDALLTLRDYGVAFGDEMAKAAVESAPYALSTGVAHDNMDGTLTLSFHVPAYNFSPYFPLL